MTQGMIGNGHMETNMGRVPAQDRRGEVHGKAWCWAARIVVLAIGLLLALAVMDEQLRKEELPLLVPLVLAVFAWRWHLVGGISIILASAALLVFLFLNLSILDWNDLSIFASLISLILLTFVPLGSILHVIAWYTEG